VNVIVLMQRLLMLIAVLPDGTSTMMPWARALVVAAHEALDVTVATGAPD
jgi:hypothetical protein